MPYARKLAIGYVLSLSFGCAAMHHVQVSDVEGSTKGQPISIKVSETTVSFRDISLIMGEVGKKYKHKPINQARRAVQAYEMLFQFGPKTGTPVFNEFYARDIPERLMAKCPSGRLTNIVSLRESREYPVVKGEIVRVDALCIKG